MGRGCRDRASSSVDQQVAVRLASTHATHEAAAVVDTAYTLAGSNAIFENRPFERRFRDVHAVTQQLQARRAHYEHVGALSAAGSETCETIVPSK